MTPQWILMIAKGESLFGVMDVLNQVPRRRRTKKLISHSRHVAGRVTVSFSNTERFEKISLPHFFNDYANAFGCNFSSHSSHLPFHDDSSMSTFYVNIIIFLFLILSFFLYRYRERELEVRWIREIREKCV